jgi:hypothetical protein
MGLLLDKAISSIYRTQCALSLFVISATAIISVRFHFILRETERERERETERERSKQPLQHHRQVRLIITLWHQVKLLWLLVQATAAGATTLDGSTLCRYLQL